MLNEGVPSDCHQFFTYRMKGILHFPQTLFTWFLDAIDIFSQKAFVESHISGHFRNIQLRETVEDSRHFIVRFRFGIVIET